MIIPYLVNVHVEVSVEADRSTVRPKDAGVLNPAICQHCHHESGRGKITIRVFEGLEDHLENGQLLKIDSTLERLLHLQ